MSGNLIFSQCNVNLGPDVARCWNGNAIGLADNISVTTPGGNPYTLTWDNGIGLDANPSVSPATTTTYTVTMTDGLGCTDTDEIVVEVSHPIANAGSNIMMCLNDITQLDGSESENEGEILGSLLYNWDNNVDSSNISNPYPTLNGTGVISLVVIDFVSFNLSCTSDFDDVAIIMNNPPNVGAGNNITECVTTYPQSYNIPEGSPTGGTWTGPNITAAGVFTINDASEAIATTLFYSFTNNAGCRDSASLIFTPVIATVLNLENDFNICENAPSVQLQTNSGTWGGSPMVTNGGTFTPSLTGDHSITYTEIDGPCTNTLDIDVEVFELPTVDAGASFSICDGSSTTINPNEIAGSNPITTYLWTGSPIIGVDDELDVEVNPTSSTTYTITITDSEGCTADDDVTVELFPIVNVNAGLDESMCHEDPAASINLTGSPVPGGGESSSWSGDVTAGGVFTDPGIGSYTLTYSFTDANSCTYTDDLTVTVFSADAVDVGPDLEFCLNDDPFQLLQPGTWSGTDVTATGLYTPATVGDFTLNFELQAGACLSQTQLNITVHGLPTADAGSDLITCPGFPVQLDVDANTPNNNIVTYLWNNGANIDNPNIATPTVSPITNQTYIITITDNEGCTDQDDVVVTVEALPNVEAGDDETICHSTITPETINFTGSPVAGVDETGIWTGIGVTANGDFTDPGVGTYTLTYTFTNEHGCINSDDLDVEVVAVNSPDVGPDLEFCLNDNAVQLTQPGTWSGTDVTATGMFTPNTVGDFTLNYTIVTGSCPEESQLEISVHGLPVVDAGPDLTSCPSIPIQLNATASTPNTPIITTFWNNGSNISDPNVLTPDVNPITTQVYILSVTDNEGCISDDDVTVTIVPLPIVDAGSDITACDQPIVETLTGYSPAGGVWSGTGITNNTGEFTSPGIGTYTVTYTYTDPLTQCPNQDDIEVTVTTPPAIDAGDDISACLDDDPITLVDFSPVVGSTWTGTGITNPAGEFDPDVSGSGIFIATLSFGSGSCLVEDTRTITVHELPVVDAGIDQSVCVDASPFNLSGFSPNDGTWSGTGITDNILGTFQPSTGVGLHLITYTYTDLITGCDNQDTKTIEVVALPVANFDLSLEQCQDANIDLTNTSTGADDYEWDFNDDTSTQENPTYAYTIPGTYTVELTANNSTGCTNTTSLEIDVLSLPTANFTVSELTGCGSLDVTFENTSSGDNLTYEWDLDNGSANTTVTTPPMTTFTELANDDELYSIELTTSNSCGSDIATINVFIQALPVADFSTDESEYCGTTVTVTNNSLGNPDDFDWDFGGLGNYTIENPPAFDFIMGTDAIDYVITLTVENECGTDETQETITILPAAITSGFITDEIEGCQPLTINITDQATGATDYLYNFDDGNTSAIAEPNHTYNDPGVYELEQAVNNLCNAETHTVTITVLANPIMGFTSTNVAYCHGQEITFENTNADTEDVNWDFDDGNTATTSNVTNTYVDAGNYDITLTGTSTINGCPGIINESITVYETPVSTFNMSILEGCSPLDVIMNNTTVGTNTFGWEFGDGAVSSDTNPIHTFINLSEVSNTYSVSMTTTSLDNCSHTTQSDLVVFPSPQIDFVLSEYESCSFPTTISVENNSIATDQYNWNITSQGTSILEEPTVTLLSPGDYEFNLSAINDFGCNSSETQTMVIHPVPVLSFLADVTTGCSNLLVDFENQTIGASTYEWDFGDGTYSFDISPTHLYLSPGDYDVRLKAFSSAGCSDSLATAGLIEVHDSPTADFDFTPDEVDIFDPFVTFTDESEGAQLWYWDFGDGEYSEITNPEHEYAETGVYPIILTVVNEFGCVDQMLHELEITSDVIIYVPTAFSPNDDGFNDIFKPSVLGTEFTDYYSFQIFNRDGDIIFETTDPDQSWVGNAFNGNYYVQEGNYTWRLVVKLIMDIDPKIQTGSVYLFR